MNPEMCPPMPQNRCPRCQTPFVEITITLGAAEATMRSCSQCDRRFWSSEGEHVELDGVLSDLSDARRG